MLLHETKNIIKIQFIGIKEDLKNITDDNKKYGRKEGWKTWAKEQNNHLRQELKNCADRTDERPIAFMRDDNKPVYAFHLQNPNKSKDYYFICVLNGNILEGRALLCGTSLVPEFVLTNNKFNYLNAKPNLDYQMFKDNPSLIDFTLNSNTSPESNDDTNSIYDSKIFLITQFIKKCYENHRRVSLSLRKYLYHSGYVITEHRAIKRFNVP